MAQKAQKLQLEFKPHMKTHQSAEIGKWFRDEGVQAITVSSVSMARYFAHNGWQDITIAFPCNLRESEAIDELAAQIRLTILVNSAETARQLDSALSNNVQAYIELDAGATRTGLSPTNVEEIERVIYFIQKRCSRIEWLGFYSHPGHSYSARSKDGIRQIHQSTLAQVKDLRQNLSIGDQSPDICIGDTPCCSVGTDFSGIDAISPGNFIFYDLMQQQIGSCNISNIAIAVQCPIIDLFPERNEIAIYGGAIHFSKEYINDSCFGYVAERSENHWTVPNRSTFLQRISQEHGIITCQPEDFERYSVGELITILPIHSCLTANLLKQYHLQSGNIISQWK